MLSFAMGSHFVYIINVSVNQQCLLMFKALVLPARDYFIIELAIGVEDAVRREPPR